MREETQATPTQAVPSTVFTRRELSLDIEEAIAGSHLSGSGPFTHRCTEWLEREQARPAVDLY